MLKKKVTVFLLFLTDILKWLFLAALTGAVVGALSAGFIRLLNLACAAVGGIPYYFLFLPFAMFVSSFLAARVSPSAEGHGTEKAIEAIHKNNGKMDAKVIPVKIAATVFTIAFGGSAGKEGPTTQIGAGAASVLAGLFRLSPHDAKRLVICGMSAAFAAIFGTPVAAAVFAVEVLVVGRLNLKNILPVMTAAVVGRLVSLWLGAPTELMPSFFDLSITQYNALPMLSSALFSGVFFGLVSLLTISVLNLTHRFAEKIKIYKPLKGLIGGGAIIVLALIFGSDYLGLGINYFMPAIEGGQVRLYDFLLKMLFTAVTLSFGGSGGILTPLMFIGITSGNAFAAVFGLDPSLYACLGMLCVLASSTNTPLACIIMAFEMFLSPGLAVLATVACPVAYLVTGHRSVYPTQRMSESKIKSIFLESTTAGEPDERIRKQTE
ncbi:MAG: chloride channel protein [Clostridiales bacterium]|jgi:H+/Cl- antiporter ClcA|nr:chloride channel protein [Clostridiales bacterium]